MSTASQAHANHNEWAEDILGEGFSALTIPLGADPDGESDVEATLVKYESPGGTQADPSKPALLWLHGMTDYFFQADTAHRFAEEGYAFYALDLRKCGRSRREDQTWHYTSNLKVYHQELTKAFDIITTKHDSVVPIAHSTGGCIIPHWIHELRTTDPQRFTKIPGVILNSPWLALPGYPEPLARAVMPLMGMLAKKFPMLPFPGGGLKSYGQSLHISEHGEFDYDLAFKPLAGHKKYISWLKAVYDNQREIQDGKVDMGIPALMLCSTDTLLERPYSEKSARMDIVLEVRHMLRYAPLMTKELTIRPLPDAIHEVYLSRKRVRDQAFDITFAWLKDLTS